MWFVLSPTKPNQTKPARPSGPVSQMRPKLCKMNVSAKIYEILDVDVDDDDDDTMTAFIRYKILYSYYYSRVMLTLPLVWRSRTLTRISLVSWPSPEAEAIRASYVILKSLLYEL